ncbi:Alpha/Beta hydrolase protein [Nemania sp. FL0916]|nr:Alpha/Beta hydrolase protein [Nemania sp. FL0916]
MDKLPGYGRSVNEVMAPTFAAYEELLKAKASDIRSARRETHTYGPHPRHVLDVYFPDKPPSPPTTTSTTRTTKTVLVFMHGGGFYSGARVNEKYAEGLIFANLGRFFTSKYGVTVVVPDYRLVHHGAKYPSGGEDLAHVVDWIRDELATQDGYESIDLVLSGNSAGGVHVSTFLLDPAFAAGRDAAIAGATGVRLRGAVCLGTPFHWGEWCGETLQAYLGEGKTFENSAIGRLQEAVNKGSVSRLSEVKFLIMISEMDPPLMFETAEEFKRLWPGEDIEIQVLEGHNHISPQLSLSTGIEREEAWGVRLAEFLKTCESD